MFTDQNYIEADEEFSYENDLQLAAQLGKSLLERNRDLEVQLRQAHHGQHGQAKEIDLLTKQLEVLRSVNESRMRIYEEVDRNAQELEKTTALLQQELATKDEKIKTLTELVTSLEDRCEEHQTTIDELNSLTKKRPLKSQRTWSVPSLPDANSERNFFIEIDYIDAALRDSWARRLCADNEELCKRGHVIRELRDQLRAERVRSADLEDTLTVMTHSLDEERNMVEEQQSRISELEAAFASVERDSRRQSHRPSSAKSDNANELLEHDLGSIRDGEVVRLKNGGSAYGSRESLNQIGLEAECSTPIADRYGMAANSAFWWPDDADTAVECSRVSLLGELEAQYTVLVRKYEALLEAKSKHCARDISTQKNFDHRPDELHLTSTPWSGIDLRSPIDPTRVCFQNRAPEYRMLFKEIFDTLKRSLVYDDEITPSNSVSSSPAESKESTCSNLPTSQSSSD